jgi:TraB family protein
VTRTTRHTPGWAARLLGKERELRMAWELERGGRRSTLVGTAHFFPYRFRSVLRSRIRHAETVLLEGPLDDDSRCKVVAAGSARRGASLIDALDAETLRKISTVLDTPSLPSGAAAIYWSVLREAAPAPAGEDLRRLEPWMAFFHFWTEYRRRDGWLYSVDLDAAAAAAALKKDVRFLETIEEQIATLGRVPLERIVRFFREVDWARYRSDYVRHYLAGDLVALTAMAHAFPTYCEAVIEERDPVLAERMLPFLERGNAIAFVGIMHCRGLVVLLRGHGYSVAGPAAP